MAKWALEVPMHMNPDDHSPEADEIRFHLYQQFFQRTGGKGFRMLPGSSSKRKRPRRGRTPGFNRMIAIRLNALHGERTDESNTQTLAHSPAATGRQCEA